MCTRTGCSLEDLPEVMDDRDGLRERKFGDFVLTARHDADDDIKQTLTPNAFIFNLNYLQNTVWKYDGQI